jgi:hypothetical protein
MTFKKNQIFTKNSKVLAFGFTEKCHFVSKTNQNNIFLVRDPYISDRLYIIVQYINIYGF